MVTVLKNSPLILLNLLILVAGYGQDNAPPFMVGCSYHRGAILPHNASIQYIVVDFVEGFETKVVFPTDGSKHHAQSLFRYPVWGLGYHYSTLGNDEVFGRAHALYAFMNIAYWKPATTLSFDYQIAFGLAYLNKTFDPDDNYFNQAIGSHMNAYIRFSTDIRYYPTSTIGLQGDIGFTHMSSGKMSVPNLGLNTLHVGIGAFYFFNRQNYCPNPTAKIPTRRKWEYSAIVSASGKYPHDYSNQAYPVFSLSMNAERYTSLKRKFGAGVDFFYDASTRELLESNRKEWKEQYDYNLGAHLSHDLVYNNLSWTIQAGYYLMYGPDKLLPVYFRTGLRYKMSRQLLASIHIKSHKAVADFIEFGIGYYWHRK